MRAACPLLPLALLGAVIAIGTVQSAPAVSAANPVASRNDECALKQKEFIKSMSARFQAQLKSHSLYLQLKLHRQSLRQMAQQFEGNIRRLRRQIFERTMSLERVLLGDRGKSRRQDIHTRQGKPGHNELQGKTVHLRRRASIRNRMHSLKRNQMRINSDIERFLKFQTRLHRLRKHQKTLQKRSWRLTARIRKQNQAVSKAKSKLQRLMTEKNRQAKSRNKEATSNRLDGRISGLKACIGRKRRQQVRLKRRIQRVSRRMARLHRRQRLLKNRQMRQLHEASRVFKRQMVARWGLLRQQHAAKIQHKASDKRSLPKPETLETPKSKPPSKTTQIKDVGPKSRAEVKHIMKQFYRKGATFRHLAVATMRSQRRIAKLKQKLSLSQRQVTEATKKEKKAGTDKEIIKQRRLKTRLLKEQQKEKNLTERVQRTTLAFSQALVKYNLKDFLKSLRDGMSNIAKVRQRVRRRRERRRKRRLARKLSRAGKRNLKLPAGAAMRQRRLEARRRRRIAKRVFRRVNTLQKRFVRELRNEAIIKKRQGHIRRRKFRLKRRAGRIVARRRWLKRRIVKVNRKITRLVKQVNKLRVLKRQADQRRVVSSSYKAENSQDASRLALRIKHKIDQIAHYRVCAIRLNRRRLGMKLRVGMIGKRIRRLSRRSVKVRRRLRREAGRIRRLVRNERKFLRRVVRKGLVKRRLVRRILRKSRSRLFVNYRGALLTRRPECKLRARAESRCSIGRIVQFILGGKKTFRRTKAELLVERLGASGLPLPVSRSVALQNRLRKSILRLKERAATASKIFNSVVKAGPKYRNI